MPLWGQRRQWQRRMLNLAVFHEQTKMYMYIENNYSCKTTEGWIHSCEQWTKDTKLRRLGSHRSPLEAGGRELVSAIVYVPFSVIGPVCSQLHCLELLASKQRKQAGITGHYHAQLASLPGAPPALQASAPGIISTFPAPCSLPKLPGTKSLYWCHFFTRPHPV